MDFKLKYDLVNKEQYKKITFFSFLVASNIISFFSKQGKYYLCILPSTD